MLKRQFLRLKGLVTNRLYYYDRHGVGIGTLNTMIPRHGIEFYRLRTNPTASRKRDEL
jgi:hypothetical protein